MKRIILLLLTLFISSKVFSQEQEIISHPEDEKIFNETKFIFNQGISLVSVTRLQTQEKRSNFVWNDALIGLYASVQTENYPVSDWYFKLQVLYPFQHQFNGMEVFAKQTILYAFDFFLGIPFQFKSYKYVNIDFTPGLHGMYQLSDEYHLGYFGAGAIVGLDFPLTRRWTLMSDGTFTFDYPNLGSNSLMQPFDMSWSWQVSIGFRYSRVKENTYYYIK